MQVGATEDSSAREETHRTTAVATRLASHVCQGATGGEHGAARKGAGAAQRRTRPFPGAAKDTQTTVLWGQVGVTNPSGGPLASMKPNVQGREQMVFEARQHGSGAGRGSGHIDVVEKSPHVLSVTT